MPLLAASAARFDGMLPPKEWRESAAVSDPTGLSSPAQYGQGPCRRGKNYSHSIIFSHGNALIFRCKFFLRTTKNRLTDPSEICALEFKHEFRRFTICSVSTTIGVNRSIFAIHGSEPRSAAHQKKTVSSLFCFPRFKLPPVVYDLTHFPGLVELVRRECPQLTLHQ